MGRRSNPAPRIPMTDLSPDLPSSAARAGLLLRQIAGVAVSLAFTFLGLLLVTFIIARVVPIDPVLSILGDRATDAQIAAERLRLGLDEPMWKQFGIYIWQAVQGDLGTSIRTKQPVIAEIAQYFPATLELATLGTIIGVALGESQLYLGISLGGQWLGAQIIAKKQGIALVGPPFHPHVDVGRAMAGGRLEDPFCPL